MKLSACGGVEQTRAWSSKSAGGDLTEVAVDGAHTMGRATSAPGQAGREGHRNSQPAGDALPRMQLTTNRALELVINPAHTLTS